MKNDHFTTQLDEICLSTVYFFEGDAPPDSIELRDCSLMVDDKKTVVSGFYGHQSRLDGFVAASAYAAKNKLQYTVIDFYVQGKTNPKLMKNKDLTDFDFFVFSRITKEVISQVSGLLDGFMEEGDEDVSLLEQVKPQVLLAKRHDLLLKLIESEPLSRFKMVACPLMIEHFNQQLTVGVIHEKQWGEIIKASCRLHPTVRVVV